MDAAAGTALQCESCANPLRPLARFCDQCGQAVTAQSFVEHKQVTVLFADVVGSMRLAAGLESERLRSIMNELFNHAAAVVQRYQGTVDKFTGDGLMALFGAPTALEDHALRACIAALEIQDVASGLAESVAASDGVDLRIRIGLNSGDVIVGEIGSGPGRYTAVGHPVGLAQRMEAAAPAGGVLCSLATANLVEPLVRLGPVEPVHAKGFDNPLLGRQLLAVEPDRVIVGRNEGLLFGRELEVDLLASLVRSGEHPVIGVTGSPGVGKSRLVGEVVALASDADVVIARCEAHTSGIAFRALSRFLRALFDVQGVDPAEARTSTAAQLGWSNGDSPEAQTLFEAMGIDDPSRSQSQLSVDGRRRMLVGSIVRALGRRPRRTILVVEDVHWIDAPSDDVLTQLTAEFDPALRAVLIATYRPGFEGALRDRFGRCITLDPLSADTTRELAQHILGPGPSPSELSIRIAQVAAGNPYFVEEIIRDLAGRGVLEGSRGDYRLVGDARRIEVPATVNAVLAARIDRLPAGAKATLNAAAVIGSQFDMDTLRDLVSPQADEHMASLVAAELIDQTEFFPEQRYCFHHPLVRTVAYESQLNSARSQTHTKLASMIRSKPGFSDMYAGLVATHLEAAGELIDAHYWHMRAAEWLRPRDLQAARSQWKSARDLADQMNGDSSEILAMRIAPRTMLTSTTLYVGDDSDSDGVYGELRDLTGRSGDLESLAVGMAGRMFSFTVNDNRTSDAVRLASELSVIRQRIHCDPAWDSLILNALAFTHLASGDIDAARSTVEEITRLPGVPEVELVPAIALGGFLDILSGNTVTGRQRLREAMQQARHLHPVTQASVLLYSGVLSALGIDPYPELLGDVELALSRTEIYADRFGITLARWLYGTIVPRRQPDSAQAGLDSLHQAYADMSENRICRCGLSTVIADLARDEARNGRLDNAIAGLRGCVEEFTEGFPGFACIPTEAFVDLLIERGQPGDLAEARAIVRRWKMGVPALDMWSIKACALLARADGDGHGFHRYARSYLETCRSLGADYRIPQAHSLVQQAGAQPRSA